jgi:quercetin dioxygenase-like cupin family protein
MNTKNLTLVSDQEIPFEIIGGGISRKIMTFCDELMLTKMQFEKGAIGAIHNHPHLQMGYVASGVFEVNVGDDKKILKQGDVFYAPSLVYHGVICLEAGELIDVFNPKRDDFL